MLREQYLEWIKDYCQNDFVVDGEEVIPAMVNMVIEELIKYDGTSRSGKTSESLGDYSVSFELGENGYPASITNKLKPYNNTYKVRFY